MSSTLVPAAAAESAAEVLAALPPAERQVVELTYYHDVFYPEIAALVGCPVHTVKTRMARARQYLAPQLDALSLTQAPDLAAHHPPQDPGATAQVQSPRRPGL